MNKKIIVLFVMFMSLALLISSFQPVNATSFYNWVKNSSFETNTNLVEDSSLEGDNLSGLVYGNWTGIEQDDTHVHSGAWADKITSGDWLQYNLTEPILGADVLELTFYEYLASTGNFTIYVYYTDDSRTDIFVYASAPSGEWRLMNVLDYGVSLYQTKYVEAFKLIYVNVQNWVDDFYLTAYTGSGVTSQDEVTFTSTPFHKWEYGGLDVLSHLDVSDISSDYNNTGLTSYKFDCQQPANYHMPIAQDINFLQSDDVEYCDYWVYMTGGLSECYASFNVQYSDGTSSVRKILVDENNTWVHVNFGISFINSGKLIKEIILDVLDTSDSLPLSDGIVYIDDVGLWCSIPLGLSRFQWNIIPASISGISGYTCSCYNKQPYTIIGYIYNSTGSLEGEGTFTYSGMTAGSGIITNGTFSFPITSRTIEGIEHIGLSLNLGTEVIVIQLRITWYSPTEPTTPPEQRTSNLVDWIVMFIVIFLPAILFAGGIYENNQNQDAFYISPIFGLIGGLVLSIGIGIYTNLLPFWLLIVIIIAVVVLIVGMIKK